MKKAYIVLEDSTVFEGYRFGADTDCVGELVFTTGMCGYIETLTDPSYYGQIVMQTFPLIGNYGVNDTDFESKKSFVSGYVVREFCRAPSNFRMEYDLDTMLKKQGIPGIYGVDTRALTQIIREHGVMNAVITSEPNDEAVKRAKSFFIADAVASVSEREIISYGDEDAKYTVVLYDFGAKRNIIRELTKRSCRVICVPYDTAAEKVMELKPDGIMLSNGPGDPAENLIPIANVKKLLGKFPLFGICLGHQITALACGGETHKLKYGHRGVNQPVKDLSSGRTYISSQNHGYAVKQDSIPPEIGCQSFENANDLTNEGMSYPTLNAFTVQFHPEACTGPKDTAFLFDRFIKLMGGK